MGALGKYKVGLMGEGGAGGMPPGNFEILHGLKCVLGASFRACIQYINTYQLPSSFSSFRSKSMTYGALVSGCAVDT